MRKRDYQAEYARRKAKAQARGYSGYSAQRKERERTTEWAKRVAQRMSDTGILDHPMWDLDEFDPDIVFDMSHFWEVFRNNYGKGTTS